MGVLLSLVTAAMFGTGDFFGGLAAKRTRVLHVVGFSHLVGFTGVLIVSLLIAEEFHLGDFGLGILGGAFGGFGVAVLYRGLARGPMAVVAPLTAITSAAVPAGWDVVTGGSLSGWTWAGVVMALAAIALVSAPAESDATPVTATVIAEALAAGVGFGAMFICLDATTGTSTPWPVVGARLITTVTLLGFIAFRRRPAAGELRGVGWLIVATGLFDTASNVVFLYAIERGQLTVVAVLSSLYPAATVVLARVLLDERMSRPQLWGFGAALAATALIAAG